MNKFILKYDGEPLKGMIEIVCDGITAEGNLCHKASEAEDLK